MSAVAFDIELPERWYVLRYHPKQRSMFERKQRFIACSASRRGGKSETAKRVISKSTWSWSGAEHGNFAYLAPTRDQAKRIAWEDLKALSPKELVTNISESELRIDYSVGSSLSVIGMDKPQRIEGPPWDGFVIDEFADMKEHAWSSTIVPALSTSGRNGWALLIGKPKGRNHWYRLCEKARLDKSGLWAHLSWPASDILTTDEFAQSRDNMDERAFRAEMLGEFISEEGRAYYAFDRDTHVRSCRDRYDSAAPLMLAFDFNVEPGVALMVQRHTGPDGWPIYYALGEIFIESDSNTPRVCSEISKRWGGHQGKVYGYGDSAGGNRGTSQLDGSDWDLITAALRITFPSRFFTRVPNSNPPVRSRINSVNFACRSASGRVRLIVDPSCQRLIADLEGVALLDNGDIDKQSDKYLTHLSDALGYLLHYEQPPKISDEPTRIQQSI